MTRIELKFLFFFLSRFSFTDTDDSQDSRRREGTIFLFHYTTSPRSRTLRHLFATLHVRWLSRVFNRNACVYQTATRWDLPPYRITIRLIDWWYNVCLFTGWIDSRLLLQRFDIGNQWIWTHIDYHPCITSETVALVVIWDACDPWHATCFTKNNNSRNKRAYTVTDIRICSKIVFAGSSYFHYHSAYGHQTWQGGDLPSGAPSHKELWSRGFPKSRDKL